MNTAVINFKTDPETKRELKKYADSLGVTISSVMNAQVRYILRTRKLVLTDKLELEPTPYLEKIMLEVEADIKHGYRNMSGPFTAEEAIAHLNSLK